MTCLSDKWHLFTFNFNNTNIIVNLDNEEYNTNLNNTIDLSDSIIYIGCNYGTSFLHDELNGVIEMLTYDNQYSPSIHSTLLHAGSITHLTKLDELDRIESKEIITHNKRLIHQYNYYDETVDDDNDSYIKVNSVPSFETLEDGSIIYYSYDNGFNITHKVLKKNGTILDNYFYQYDALSRLIEEKCYTGTTFSYHKKI